MDSIRRLYYETHIVPTEEDYQARIANNQCYIYMILYWINKEHLYPLFVEEEMDIDALFLMQESDLHIFHLENNTLFRQFIRSLRPVEGSVGTN